MELTNRIDKIDEENIARIKEIKADLGDELVILGHYYQRLSIALLADKLGDSYGLSALAARSKKAKYIVFCGVEFMAESADILRQPKQKVFHPHFGAGCPMADMAGIEEVESAYEKAELITGRKVIPVAYMNTSSEVKAFCGQNDGIICTSSNAPKAFQWAYDRGGVVLFLPDEHLGTNTADVLKIPEGDRVRYDPFLPEGEAKSLIRKNTRLVLWKGYCHVHTWFTPEIVQEARDRFPNARIVVHPECPREVVAMADQNGSTAFMHLYAKEAPPGSLTLIGTEINMVDYLRHQYGKDKEILPLSRSFCPNMFKVNLRNLRETLENLSKERFLVNVDPQIKKDAKKALSRMLELE